MSDDEDSIERPESDIEALRISREEARVVLDHQISILSDIDDKAMRTVRITLLVLGLILSASTLPASQPFLNWASISGIIVLVGAIICGIATYSASSPELGFSESYLRDVRNEQYDEREWLSVVLAGYEEWIDDMDDVNKVNVWLLTGTQFLLGVGVILLATGVLSGLFGVLDPLIQPQDLPMAGQG